MRGIVLALCAAAGPGFCAPLSPLDAVAAANVSRNSLLGPSSASADALSFLGNDNRTGLFPTVLAGDFVFSARLQPLAPDDDVIGLIFGYQDADTNLRLGWEGGGSSDPEAGTNGLWLVAEEAGTTHVLFEDPTLFWRAGTEYEATLTVSGSMIDLWLRQGPTTLARRILPAPASTAGRVGAYANSQSAVFTQFDLSVPMAPVPLPASLILLGGALLGWGTLRRRSGT